MRFTPRRLLWLRNFSENDAFVQCKKKTRLQRVKGVCLHSPQRHERRRFPLWKDAVCNTGSCWARDLYSSLAISLFYPSWGLPKNKVPEWMFTNVNSPAVSGYLVYEEKQTLLKGVNARRTRCCQDALSSPTSQLLPNSTIPLSRAELPSFFELIAFVFWPTAFSIHFRLFHQGHSQRQQNSSDKPAYTTCQVSKLTQTKLASS